MGVWAIDFDEEFEDEFRAFEEDVQDALLAAALLLADYGPRLGRPWVDTLKGSRYANRKELRFDSRNGTWRAAFAFDPRRRAVLLVAGSKAGIPRARFYRRLIDKADRRFGAHLERLRSSKEDA